MKKITLFFQKHFSLLLPVFCLLIGFEAGAQSVLISDQPLDTAGDASAVFELKSLTKGFLPPRMPETARLAIANPAQGLLVYQNDAVKGFYYYKDSAWSFLSESAHTSVIPVNKETDDTLSKTETIVLASNNVAITLPLISSADDGLSINIKNVGTHTDLVTIKANAGSIIDGATLVPLPRWFAVSLVAKNGNWYFRQRTSFAVDVLEVSWHSPWKTVQEALEFLNMHMWGPAVIKLGAGSYSIAETQTINLPFPLTIQGTTFGATYVNAEAGLTGKPMFICESECSFKMLAFEGSTLTNYGKNIGEDAIRLRGNDEYYEIKDCSFNMFSKAISVEEKLELWLFETDISNTAIAGVEINSAVSGVFFKVSETDFSGCEKGINLLKGSAATISIINCGFYKGSLTSVGVNYVPATFTAVKTVAITSNTWDHTGSFINGFDFSRADGRDKDVEIIGNIGDENQNPHCKVNLLNNATTTPITSTWVKANWNSVSQSQTPCKFTVATNRITYQSANDKDLIMWISGNASVASNNKIVNIAIVKNGNPASRFGETSLRLPNAGQPFQWSTVVYLANAVAGEYFEVWVNYGTTGSETLVLQDMNWFTNSQ